MSAYNAAAGDNDFGFGLLSQVEKGKNAAISPYNIRSALAMLYEGAVGETAKEIAAVAGFAENLLDHRLAFLSLINSINKDKVYTLNKDRYFLRSANGLWIAENYPIQVAYVANATLAYHANISKADFRNNANGVRDEINSWVSKETENKITELFPANSLNRDTILAIASALYFKGQWDAKFSPEHTQKQDFTLAGGEKVQVEMMRKGALEMTRGGLPKFQYTEFDGAQVVALPYQGKEIMKVVLLPPQGETVDNLVAELQRQQKSITALTSSMVNEDFSRLELPKHEVRGDYKLIPLLQGMGIERMFSQQNAQFDGITGQERLYVSSGVHKTFFKTDEEGSEGAAATGFGVARTTSIQRPKIPKEFVANRPFLEAVDHQATGSVLFLNRIENPRN